MEIKAEKKQLRSIMLAARLKLESTLKQKYDNAICARLSEIIFSKGYKIIHAYIPMANEIDITPLLQELLAKKMTVISPKTLPARALENRILTSLTELETGIKGTQHPLIAKLYNGSYDLIIVPGLAFDDRNYRLGYGGGYYDNFIATQTEAFKLGIFYPFQKVDDVPIEAHDVCLDEVLVGEF